MDLVLVDTSVWIDFFRGRSTAPTDWLNEALGFRRMGIPDLSLAELLQGASDASVERLERSLRAVVVVGVGGEATARRAAANYRALRGQGVTIRSTIDCLIATFAIDHNLPLLHSDRDFVPFERYLNLKSALELPEIT